VRTFQTAEHRERRPSGARTQSKAASGSCGNPHPSAGCTSQAVLSRSPAQDACVSASKRAFGFRILSALLWLLASASAYLYILNRRLIQARDGPYKSPGIRAGALVTGALALLVGWRTAGTRALAAPVAVLSIAGIGEVRRWRLHRHSRGSPPVHEENAGVRLGRPETTTDLALRRYALTVTGWRGPRLRIAHISDLHVNSHLPLSYYQSVMRRVAMEEPDLIFFTGDFVTYPQFAPLLPQVLALAQGRYGRMASSATTMTGRDRRSSRRLYVPLACGSSATGTTGFT
jgi:hypothetical protein